VADTDADVRLERLLRRQRILAWLLSIYTFAMTVGFFALMGFDAPILSHIAFGRSITVANAMAACMIVSFVGSIAWFGWRAARIDQLLTAPRRNR
jgi:uncharacterized membrane protein (DUF485 family)